MNFNDYCRSQAGRYPEYVTQKETSKILGICISKVYRLEKEGAIPFEYTNTAEGRRQQIKTVDVLEYQYAVMCFDEKENEYTAMLRSYYLTQLKSYPNLLLVADIMRITGYAKTTINNWLLNGKLEYLKHKGKRIHSFVRGKGFLVPKDIFIDFLTGTYYRSITRKSSIHREQANEYEKLFMDFLVNRGAENVKL